MSGRRSGHEAVLASYDPASGAIILGALVVGLTVWMVSNAAVAVVVGSIVLLGAVEAIEDHRRTGKLKEGRAGESLCTFARGFPRRDADPWILRATCEGIQALLPGVAIRPGDRFKRELHIAGDDLDDLAEEVARRSGRAWDRESTKRNPYRGGVETVADLMRFMELQPRKTEA